MPNLVVYVPAKLWQRMEAELGAEFPAWARKMTVKHMQEFLDGRHVTAGLSEGVQDAGRESVGAPRVRQDESSQGSKLPSVSVPPSESPDPHFKPDPK